MGVETEFQRRRDQVKDQLDECNPRGINPDIDKNTWDIKICPMNICLT